MVQTRKRRPSTPKQAARCASPLDALLAPAFFKALGDATRVRLLGCMSKCGRACSVSEVAECCHVDFSVVSRHLAMLERAGILRSSKEGRVVRYEVRFHDLALTMRSLAEAFEQCCPNGARPRRGGCCGD
jgi:DNA-binding transcriptional ArsR family regulator